MEYCSSVSNSTMNKKKKQISGNFLSEFSALCSFVLSHPLYLSYFLFFSPYIIKLLAFLSPLFFTTCLLCLSLFTSLLHESLTFSSLIESLQQRFDRIGGEEEDESLELEGFEEFEVYIIVFGSSTFDPHGEFSQFGSSDENPVEFSREIDDGKEEKVLGVLISEEKESPVENSGEIEGKFCGIPISDQVGGDPIEEELEEEKILGVLISDEWCFPAKDEKSEKKLIIDVVKAEEKSPQMADKKCVELGEVLTASNYKPLELTPSSINGGNQTQMKSHSRKHGEADWDTNYIYSTCKKHDDDEEDKFSYSESPLSEGSLSNMGSMRKEKEWRRTLACKLFEERHNVGGGGGGGVEEMDSLWEAYEKTEENRGKQRTVLKKKNSVLSFDEEDEDEEEEEEEEERDNGKLCCLQALKFSAVKMNFGMGKKPGFLKITKAFKGIGGGWLSHHSNHRSSGGRKKGKN